MFAQLIELFSLNLFAFFHTECVQPANYNLQLSMAFTSLVALGALSVVVGEFMKRCLGGTTVVNSVPVKAFIVLISVVLPMMSTMALSAFNCDQVGCLKPTFLDQSAPVPHPTPPPPPPPPPHPPPQFETDGRVASFLTIDYSIACQSQEGKAARVLAAFAVIVFPVGVPLALFTLLYRIREEIMDREARSGDKDLSYIGA